MKGTGENVRCSLMVTSVAGDECVGHNAHKRTQQRGLEKLGPHAREKLARVGACEVSVLFTEDVLGDHLHDVQFAHDVRCARHGAIEKSCS